MVEHASCCESPEVVTADDSSSVCAKCGVVIADCILVGGADAGYLESAAHRSEGRTNTATGTTGYNRLTYKHTAPVTGVRLRSWTDGTASLTKLQDSLTNILHGLHLPQLLKGQTMAHFNVAIKGLDIPPGSKAKPCLAVCLYIAMQQSKIIKSMSELLMNNIELTMLPSLWNTNNKQYQFNITLDQFSGIFYKVKHILAIPIPAMDIAVYLPRLCQAVYPDDSTNRTYLHSLAVSALRIAKHAWLHVGRRESSLVSAVVLIAYEAIKSRGAPSRIVDLVATTAGCSIALAKTRLLECKRYIIDYAQKLPFFSHIKLHSSHKYLLDILEKVDMLLAVVDRPSLPIAAQTNDLESEIPLQPKEDCGALVSSNAVSRIDDSHVSLLDIHSGSLALTGQTSGTNFNHNNSLQVSTTQVHAMEPSVMPATNPSETVITKSRLAYRKQQSNPSSTTSLPPSFIKAMKQRQLMAVRIQRAKLRISLKSNAGRSGGDESVDAKDELVEALLRGGVADEDIYNYKMKRDYVGVLTMEG
ncbi:hypothetical protein BSLG_008005 [Batrachochytrium salamandrivorans]|nr:hypothetical protein BSLG_008005 [Batrachochytrium salamandrivorans]